MDSIFFLRHVFLKHSVPLELEYSTRFLEIRPCQVTIGKVQSPSSLIPDNKTLCCAEIIKKIIAAEYDSSFCHSFQLGKICGVRRVAVVERLIDFGRLSETPPTLICFRTELRRRFECVALLSAERDGSLVPPRVRRLAADLFLCGATPPRTH